MIRAVLFRPTQPPREVPQADWAAVQGEDHVILWVDAESPTREEFGELARTLAIDPRAVERVRRVTRPATRTYRGHYLVTAQAVDVDERRMPRIVVTELDIVVGGSFVLTAHDGPLPFLADIEERTAAFADVGAFDPSYLLYVLLDTLVSQYTRELDEVEDHVERLEEQIL